MHLFPLKKSPIYNNNSDLSDENKDKYYYWMAPEVILTEKPSFSGDIWSFGCICLEMIQGFPPFSKLNLNEDEIIKLITSGSIILL